MDIRDREKHNYKLTNDDKADIIMTHMLSPNLRTINKLMDKYNLSKRGVYDVIKNKKNKMMVQDALNEKNKQFTKKCTIIIDKALNKINEELESGEDIDINKLATTLGILYDKSRLESGLSTENKAISVNITID